MFVAAATTDSTVVVDGAGIIIAGETMASMTGAVVNDEVAGADIVLDTCKSYVARTGVSVGSGSGGTAALIVSVGRTAVGPGVNHSRYKLHTDREVHTGRQKEECIYGRLEQHEIFADGSGGVVQQAEVSYSKKGLRHALYCLQETMSLVGQAFTKVLKEPT